MADVVFLLVVAAFFAIALAAVAACDRIVAADEAGARSPEPAPEEPVRDR